MVVNFYQPMSKCRYWTTCKVMVVKADRRASPSITKKKGAITIATKTDDQIHSKASYAIYVASQIILHAIGGITHRISMVVTTCMVVNVAELTNEVASTNSKLD